MKLKTFLLMAHIHNGNNGELEINWIREKEKGVADEGLCCGHYHWTTREFILRQNLLMKGLTLFS